mmetsp:Transcript_13360/g.25092  ORF Transcript_13360/g.25092 Transcript_13360/m.25092 type:complete len:179 (-) Transcript_13360:10820-11356(-)
MECQQEENALLKALRSHSNKGYPSMSACTSGRLSPALTTRVRRRVNKQSSADAFPPWLEPTISSPEPSVLPVTELWSLSARVTLQKIKGATVRSKVGKVFWQHAKDKKKQELALSLKYPHPLPATIGNKGLKSIIQRYNHPKVVSLPPILQQDEDSRSIASPETRPRVKFAVGVRFSN